MAVAHPIPYQGSKRLLAPTILAYLPRSIERLVEPFAGSAAISLAAAQRGQALRFVLNDANQPLIALWEALLQRPQELAAAYADVWTAQHGQERSYFEMIRGEFNRTREPHLLLFLLTRCVKAAVRYNASGAFNQSADHRRNGTHPRTMRRQILSAAALLGGKTTLIADDYRDVLQAIVPEDVVYLDPPYQGVCQRRDQRYVGAVTYGDLVEALTWLNDRGIAYALSYDGRSGPKTFGEALPGRLGLLRLEVAAGRSAQATLLGRQITTYEALYLSPALQADGHRFDQHLVSSSMKDG